ncbi:MAG: sensor histidine kinase [Candidatus Aquicultorales bacterium]
MSAVNRRGTDRSAKRKRTEEQTGASFRNRDLERVDRISRNIQLIADLSYADTLLCCPNDRGAYVVRAAAKPNTSTSLYRKSPVGTKPRAIEAVRKAIEKRAKESGVQRFSGEIPVRVEATPLMEGERIIGVVVRERNATERRRPSEMERVYMKAADELLGMLEEGAVDVAFSSSKEAGDGLIWVDTAGIITYVTPNAVTIYKRLGFERELVGEHFDELGLDEKPVAHALRELLPSMEEISEREMTVVKKAIPLVSKGRLKGVISIIRDVTDLRARELELRIKEATIREIHHRVKNNLQTIASLLRLQARRMSLAEAQEALLESVGRISSIAVVHEILSQRGDGPVDFSEITRNIAQMVKVGLVYPGSRVEIEMVGESGTVPAQVATSLALVVTELVQNAVEHAFMDHHAGRVVIRLARRNDRLSLEVSDDGSGLPEGFDPERDSNLGLQIVKTLVEEELKGDWAVESQEGTSVLITIPIDDSWEARDGED